MPFRISSIGVLLGLMLNPVTATASETNPLGLNAQDMAATSQAMTPRELPMLSTSGRPATGTHLKLPTPPLPQPSELLVTYSERRTGAKLEMGALGGGRADAPGLVHVGLAMNF